MPGGGGGGGQRSGSGESDMGPGQDTGSKSSDIGGFGMGQSSDSASESSSDSSSSESSDSAGCFKAGTIVAVSKKDKDEFVFKKIEKLNVGDEIVGISFNKEGEPMLSKSQVEQLFVHEPNQYSFLELETERGAKIVATNNHRIITNSQNGAVAIDGLNNQHPVVSAFSAPRWDKISKVKFVNNEEVPVFNIKTKTSNYLVSKDGKGWVLVHNWK